MKLRNRTPVFVHNPDIVVHCGNATDRNDTSAMTVKFDECHNQPSNSADGKI